MTVATVKFIDLLQGHYRNQRQAMSNPSRWPQIDIRLTSMSEQQIEAKSWYKYKGEEDPYNIIRYDLEEVNQNVIYSKTYNLLTDKPSCPFIWQYVDNWWHGNLDGECIQGTTRMVSKIRFNGTEYRAIDTGYDLKTGAFRWGKEESEGEFYFTRLAK